MGWNKSARELLEQPTESLHETHGGADVETGRVPSNRQQSDREQLKQSSFTILTDHPVLTLLAVLLFGALVFSRVLP